MLTHRALGPTTARRYLVVYDTPGCCIPTVACDCTTPAQAEAETTRLNAAQVAREKAIRYDRELRGLRGVYHGLGPADR